MPLTLREAAAFIAEHHRHHEPPRGCIAVVGCALRDELGRAVDGNACSFLYGAAWRAVRALGYRRLVTYTLPEEGGASLRGAGFRLLGEAGGGSWSRGARPRVDMHPTQSKLRWERAAHTKPLVQGSHARESRADTNESKRKGTAQ